MQGDGVRDRTHFPSDRKTRAGGKVNEKIGKISRIGAKLLNLHNPRPPMGKGELASPTGATMKT